MTMNATIETAAEPDAVSQRLTFVLAAACGMGAANIYYAQPLIAPISAALGLSHEAAGLIVTMTQIGYGVGLLFIVPLGDLVENRTLMLRHHARRGSPARRGGRVPCATVPDGRAVHRARVGRGADHHSLCGAPCAGSHSRPCRRQRLDRLDARHHAGATGVELRHGDAVVARGVLLLGRTDDRARSG